MDCNESDVTKLITHTHTCTHSSYQLRRKVIENLQNPLTAQEIEILGITIPLFLLLHVFITMLFCIMKR